MGLQFHSSKEVPVVMLLHTAQVKQLAAEGADQYCYRTMDWFSIRDDNFAFILSPPTTFTGSRGQNRIEPAFFSSLFRSLHRKWLMPQQSHSAQ